MQALAEGQGQALAGLAGGGQGERELGEALAFGDGGVALQDGAEEEVGGDRRSKAAFAEGELQVAAERGNDVFREEFSGVALDTVEHLMDTEHGGLLL